MSGIKVRAPARGPPVRFPRVPSPAAERSAAPTTLAGRSPAGLLCAPPGQELGGDPPAHRAPAVRREPRREPSGGCRSAGFRPSTPSQGLLGLWVLRGRRLPRHSFLVTSSGFRGPRRKLRTLVSPPGSEDTWSLCAPTPAPTSRALFWDPRGLRETRAKWMGGGVRSAGVCDAKTTGVSTQLCARTCAQRCPGWCFS